MSKKQGVETLSRQIRVTCLVIENLASSNDNNINVLVRTRINPYFKVDAVNPKKVGIIENPRSAYDYKHKIMEDLMLGGLNFDVFAKEYAKKIGSYMHFKKGGPDRLSGAIIFMSDDVNKKYEKLSVLMSMMENKSCSPCDLIHADLLKTQEQAKQSMIDARKALQEKTGRK